MNVQTGRANRVANVIAERTVERAKRLGGVFEGESDALDRRDRDDRLQNPAVGRKERQRAGARLLQRLRVAAELVVREDRNLELPAGLFVDGVPALAHP